MKSRIAIVVAVSALAAVAVPDTGKMEARQQTAAPIVLPMITTPVGAAAVEQTSPGAGQPAALVATFDGLGVGFKGPLLRSDQHQR